MPLVMEIYNKLKHKVSNVLVGPDLRLNVA